ncbi:hypothetical protein D3C83_200910 [compost metagenome]
MAYCKPVRAGVVTLVLTPPALPRWSKSPKFAALVQYVSQSFRNSQMPPDDVVLRLQSICTA